MRQHDDGPGAIIWLIALISAALPWIGVGVGLAGVWKLGQGDAAGWWMVAGGCVILAADVLINFVWARPSVFPSDQPGLNRRAEQFVGRILVVEEAIENGRGKVRAGDTLWPASGPDCPAGTRVRVIGVSGELLAVQPV